MSKEGIESPSYSDCGDARLNPSVTDNMLQQPNKIWATGSIFTYNENFEGMNLEGDEAKKARATTLNLPSSSPPLSI